MGVKVIFIPSKEDFSLTEKRLIEKIIVIHARKALTALRYKPANLSFTVYPWERDGMHGFTQAKDWIKIIINPKQFRTSRAAMKERLPFLVYHELHHAARGYVGYLPGKKKHILMDCIISEGLADAFAREQHPSRYVLSCTSYDVKEVRKWLPGLQKIKWRKEYFGDPWIGGGEGKPKLLGYKIGRYIIENVKQTDDTLTASKLVKHKAKAILELGKLQI